MGKVLIIEPFYGGSHKKLIDTISKGMNSDNFSLITMTAKKWPWRARCSSLYISQNIPNLDNYSTLFCSSVLSLAELIGLRPQLATLKKVVYFHENQLAYPVKNIKERDYQYGYNQITTCIAADTIVFNSEYNMNSFLENLKRFIKIMPDFRLKDIDKIIKDKMIVLYFPIDFSVIDKVKSNYPRNLEANKNKPVHIVWPHRWEFDKNPQLFFDTLYRLKENNVNFQLSILGESFSEIPEIFTEAKEKLVEHISHFGYVDSLEKFYEILCKADIVVSTADHEFFGVSMLEAVRCGCIPLAPKSLVYPEIYPEKYLFESPEELFCKLKSWCSNDDLLTDAKNTFSLDFEKFGLDCLLPKFLSLLDVD